MNSEKIAGLVSVIVPCHNAEDYIDDCITALLEQTYQNFEILICDDASTDGSYDVLTKWQEKDSRIHIFKNETNMYAAFTRNRCIEASVGEFIMIQDVDDISAADRMEKEIAVLNADENIDFVSGGVYMFNDDPKNPVSTTTPKHEYPKKRNLLWRPPFFHGATMFRRECIVAVDGYRVAPETKRCQDYDLYLRLYAKGYRGKNIKDKIYYYRLDSDNIKRRSWAARKGEIKIRYKGFRAMHLMPWALPFVLKPVFAHLFQKIKYRKYVKK